MDKVSGAGETVLGICVRHRCARGLTNVAADGRGQVVGLWIVK
jgi:hypothetical protein